MDTNTLTSALPAANSPRAGPRSSAVVPAADESTNSASSAVTRPTGREAVRPSASTVEAPSLNQPVETAAEGKAESQNLVQETLRKLNDLNQTSIAFSQHEETGRTVITVTDKETGEEIRTIPSEDFLAIAAHLEEALDSPQGLQPGLLVSSRA